MITPKEAAEIIIPGYVNEALDEFCRKASARELQEFLFWTHGVVHTPGKRCIETAIASLHIRLSEDAKASTEKVVVHTEKLTVQTAVLLKETRKLGALTIALVILTFVLLFVTIVQLIIAFKDEHKDVTRSLEVSSTSTPLSVSTNRHSAFSLDMRLNGKSSRQTNQ
jgi:hypothetical protein